METTIETRTITGNDGQTLTFASKNRRSAKEMIISENSVIEFIENPNKKGKIFFKCGNTRGYCSPEVQKNYATLSVDELKTAEVQITRADGKAIDGGDPRFIPMLMVVGNSKANVKRELGADLLH